MKGRLRKSEEGRVTFWGAEMKSAHTNGTYGDIRVYTFIEAVFKPWIC